MKKQFLLFTIFHLAPLLFVQAGPLFSPTWGFRLDIPEGYELSGGDGANQFSFSSPFESNLDIIIYTGRASAAAIADELEQRLSNRGRKHVFTYNGREAALLELRITQGRNTISGWALCLELEARDRNNKVFLAALAFGPDSAELQHVHLSVLDTIEGGEGDRRRPGVITEFFHPRGEWVIVPLANSNESAHFRANDAVAAQALVDREFEVMKLYLNSPLWQEAWKRFYRAIYKDAFNRLEDTAFRMERSWNNAIIGPSGEGIDIEEADRLGSRNTEARHIAAKALEWVQGFEYERDLLGSDFVNLVTAAIEGRGDCDSRAMLWIIILQHANIRAGLMVSREYSHAMGMADLEGQGARFPMRDYSDNEIRWLVAETTVQVALGLIGETVSDIDGWLGVLFE